MCPTPSSLSGINPDFKPSKKRIKSVSYYLNGLKAQNKLILSECITLLESTNEAKRTMATNILRALPKSEKMCHRIGITGAPGVGKSTFIEAFGLYLISKKHRPAILAIDPSSQMNRGSILGDKTRMQVLSNQAKAYIRPSPSGLVLGGIGSYTKEAILLCEAAGFDYIIIETVGVGQSEIEVSHISDINLLLLQPGAGDDMQGIKRGIMEKVDICIINKADGSQMQLAKQTKLAYNSVIHFFHHEVEAWKCPVILVSSTQNTGISEVYKNINTFFKRIKDRIENNRIQQELRWFENQSKNKLLEIILKNKQIAEIYQDLKKGILCEGLPASLAFQQLSKTIDQKLQ